MRDAERSSEAAVVLRWFVQVTVTGCWCRRARWPRGTTRSGRRDVVYADQEVLMERIVVLVSKLWIGKWYRSQEVYCRCNGTGQR